MKQIKDIIREVRLSEVFDQEVNDALAEGWALVKRELLPAFDTQARIHFGLLHAELERETVEQTEERETVEQTEEREAVERVCGNCRYYGTKVYDFPCTCCLNINRDKWEPAGELEEVRE